MAGRKSLLSFGFSSNRAEQAASAGNSGLLPLDPAPNRGPLLISHLSQRVSLRRTLDLISVKLRMRKKQQQKMMSLVRQQSMANQQP